MKHVRVTVEAINSDNLVLELPSGSSFHWPLDENDTMRHVAVGDELYLFLGSEHTILNKLLTDHDNKERTSE